MTHRIWVGLLAALCFAPSAAGQSPTTLPATRPAIAAVPPREQVILLPLHVHVLSADGRPDIHSTLTDDDLTRILGKVNRIWRQAGVQFVVTVHREPAENVEQFDQQKAAAPEDALGVYRTLAPAGTRRLPGIHVYYVHTLPPNGVYLGANICFVKDTASLRKVEGGIDEPIPRVTSHEIGHALGLPHRQDRTNLMASGTTGTSFNDAEVRIARGKAEKQPGKMTLAEAETAASAAETSGDTKQAAALRKAIPAE
jgi:hypothetical protein